MKPSSILALAPFLGVACARPTENKPPRFDVVAVSEGPVQYYALAQSSSFFYLGQGDGNTDSFCPPKIEKAGRCPPGKDTVLKDAHTLDTVVPGQIIYVDSNYAVRATGPNSGADDEDKDNINVSTSDGFKHIPGDQSGQWDYQADGVDGFLACPYNNGIYQVYVNSADAKPPRGQKLDTCVPFTAGTVEYKLPANATAAAWQY
ncbi:unnamed protein product [Penicillium olsonii]|nr:unnamed protein product [Penicillium olsonii]CAG7934263.1 unnamed protein product [Penicillium olsonii]